jgi:hypothetical protein
LTVISTQLPTTNASEEIALEKRGQRDLGYRQRRPGGGQWTRACGFLLDRLQHRLGFFAASIRFEPARRLRQGFAQVPDDQSADAGDDEHRPPPKAWNDDVAEQGRYRQSRNDQEGHEGEPAPARTRWDELGESRVANDDFRAQSKPHNQPERI